MITYRISNIKDLSFVAKIHKEQFPTHYLGQFSISFLEFFYKNLLNDGHLFLVAEENGQIVGFVLGGEWKKISESLSAFMKKNIVRSLIESLIRPKTWKKSIQKFLSLFSRREGDPHNLDNIEQFTLLSIATGKKVQGKGIGSGLVSAFNEEIIKKTDRYYLSVQDTNDRAINFYKKLGFVEAYRCPGEIQMIKDLMSEYKEEREEVIVE